MREETSETHIGEFEIQDLVLIMVPTFHPIEIADKAFCFVVEVPRLQIVVRVF